MYFQLFNLAVFLFPALDSDFSVKLEVSVINKFYDFTKTPWFWIAGIVYLLVMEGIALYFQYALDMYPCALCVQIRAWVLAAIISGIIGLIIRKYFLTRLLGIILTLAFLGGALYTSGYAWGVEKGKIVASCGMGAGFPDFMPLDQWFPLLFEAQGICGRTPQMWFGLSMSETLLITLTIPVLILVAALISHMRDIYANPEKSFFRS